MFCKFSPDGDYFASSVTSWTATEQGSYVTLFSLTDGSTQFVGVHWRSL